MPTQAGVLGPPTLAFLFSFVFSFFLFFFVLVSYCVFRSDIKILKKFKSIFFESKNF
jgi:hypothetical protein